MHQMMIGEAEQRLEEAHLWAGRQLLLETAEPEILPKAEVVRELAPHQGRRSASGRFEVTQYRAEDVRHVGRADGQRARPRLPRRGDGSACRRSRPSAASSTSPRWSSTARAGAGFTTIKKTDPPSESEARAPAGSRSPTTSRCSAGCGTTSCPGYAPDGTRARPTTRTAARPGRCRTSSSSTSTSTASATTQTNVVLRGRAAARAHLQRPHRRRGAAVSTGSGPEAPPMLGVSGGPGVLVFTPARVDGPRHTAAVLRPRLDPPPRRRPAHPHHHALPRRRDPPRAHRARHPDRRRHRPAATRTTRAAPRAPSTTAARTTPSTCPAPTCRRTRMTATPSPHVDVPALRQLVDGDWSPRRGRPRRRTCENPNTGEVIARPARRPPTSDVDAAAAAAAAVARRGRLGGRSRPSERAAMLEAVADALDAEADAARRARVARHRRDHPHDRHARRGHQRRRRSGWPRCSCVPAGPARRSRPERAAGRDAPPARGARRCRLVPWNAPAPDGRAQGRQLAGRRLPRRSSSPASGRPYGTSVLGRGRRPTRSPRPAHPAASSSWSRAGPHVGGRARAGRRGSARSRSPAGSAAAGRSPRPARTTSSPPSSSSAATTRSSCSTTPTSTSPPTGVVDLLTQLNGQWCRALGRLIVHAESVADAAARGGARQARRRCASATRCRWRPTSARSCTPATWRMLRGRIAELQSPRAARRTRPRALPDLPGNFLAPTLVTGVARADAQDEIFGPVATVHTVHHRRRGASQLANARRSASRATSSPATRSAGMAVARSVRAGGVKVNGSTMIALNLFAPRPAWGLAGQGEEGTAETFQFFTNHARRRGRGPLGRPTSR